MKAGDTVRVTYHRFSEMIGRNAVVTSTHLDGIGRPRAMIELPSLLPEWLDPGPHQWDMHQESLEIIQEASV